jgi:hypothetical protein
MSPFATAPTDVEAAWKRISAKLDAMTPEEKRGTLIDAGILTKSGRVHKRYRNVIVPIDAKPDGK